MFMSGRAQCQKDACSEAALKESKRQRALEDEVFEKMIPLVFANFDMFKNILEAAAANYTTWNQNNFFPGSEKKRAQSLLELLSKSQNQCDVIDALNASRSKSKLHDPLMAFIYRGIRDAFYEDKVFPYKIKYPVYFLGDLVDRMREKLLSGYIMDATNLPSPLSEITSEYLKRF